MRILGFLRFLRHLGLLALALAGARADAGPANATCAAAQPISYPSRTEDTTAGVASSTITSTCGHGDTAPAWFMFVAPSDGRYRFRTEGGRGISDTTLALYPSCTETSTACVDDIFDSLFGLRDLDMRAGDTIYVRVAGWGGTQGDFYLEVAHPEDLQRPPNDECDSAIPLRLGVPVQTTTLFSTGVDSSSCGSDDSTDQWFTYTPTAAGDYHFYITGNLISATLLSVQTGCGSGELACGLASATAHVEADQTVFLRVGIDPNASDSFNVWVGPFAPAPPVPNDDFLHAETITHLGTTEGTTFGATADNIYFGPGCGPFINAAVWYSFTATVSGTYVFDTNGSFLEDTFLAAMGPCTSGGTLPPQLLGCDDDMGEGKHSRLEGTLMVGDSVCLAVGGHYLSEYGDFRLNIQLANPPPPNDRCATAIPLQFPDEVYAENFSARPESTGLICPSDEFALWYRFQAPEDGDFKFDTKETREAQPDLAIFDHCDGNVLSCSQEPRPVLWRHLRRGEEVWIRVASNVFVRGAIDLRVGPDRPLQPQSDAGVMDGAEAEDASAPDVALPDLGASADAGIDGATLMNPGQDAGASTPDAGSPPDGGAQEGGGGCGCSGISGNPASGSISEVILLAVFPLVIAARRPGKSRRYRGDPMCERSRSG
ncbi:MAG: hypothetical protein U1E65_27420 [Myxococcota bacterium]